MTTNVSMNPEVATAPTENSQESLLELQRRLAWEQDQAMIEDFFSDPSKYLKSFWEQYKPVIVNLGIILAGFFALKVLFSLISFVTDLPLVSPFLELIGLGYTGWFIYHYLLKVETRKELFEKITQVRRGVVDKAEATIDVQVPEQ
jgi:CAAD domains of cyanobacterial aminoacyl-tRNA synthetase